MLRIGRGFRTGPYAIGIDPGMHLHAVRVALLDYVAERIEVGRPLDIGRARLVGRVVVGIPDTSYLKLEDVDIRLLCPLDRLIDLCGAEPSVYPMVDLDGSELRLGGICRPGSQGNQQDRCHGKS